MLSRAAATIILLFLFALRAPGATYTFEYSPNCSKAYSSYLSLHLQDARSYLAQEAKANPGNLIPIFLADYDDCIVLLLNSSPKDLEQRSAHLAARIAALDKGDEHSPWQRLCKAGVYLHWAIINVRFGDQYKAAINFHRSFSLLNDNRRLFPAFEYNNVYAGLQEAVVGSLPGSYKRLASVFGMKGSIKKGTEKLATFVNTHNAAHPFYAEAVLYHLYSRFYLLSEQQEVWNFINTPQFPTHNNLLNTFAKANIALDYRKCDAAIDLLRAAGAEPEYNTYPVFDHQLGAALLTRLDTAAVFYFRRFLARNTGDSYIKDTWQKMSYAWYVNNDMPKATYCMEQMALKGTARIDADKQAARQAENKTWPMKALLQARLLIEGGYYERALALLQHIDQATLPAPADKAEYSFRLGRVYEELAAASTGKAYYQLAFAQYRAAVATGKDRHEQFAARAALHMGRMYERLQMNAEALEQYEQCLDMPAHDFQNSIDMQAKAGMNRIEGK